MSLTNLTKNRRRRRKKPKCRSLCVYLHAVDMPSCIVVPNGPTKTSKQQTTNAYKAWSQKSGLANEIKDGIRLSGEDNVNTPGPCINLLLAAGTGGVENIVIQMSFLETACSVCKNYGTD